MGGGGSHNPNIVNYLKEQMPNTRITYMSEIGIPIGAKEALGFALLGLECFVGRPMIVPQHTESSKAGLVGQIQPGRNMHRIRQHVAQVSLTYSFAMTAMTDYWTVLGRFPRRENSLYHKDEPASQLVHLRSWSVSFIAHI